MERVVIISDISEIRSGLASRVKATLGDQIQVRMQTGKDASLQSRDADLILIHTRMSRASSLEVAKRMKKENPAALLIFFQRIRKMWILSWDRSLTAFYG